MRVIWLSDHPVTASAITEALNVDRTLAYTTVMTVVERLRAKQMLTRVREGRFYLYSPAQSPEDYTAGFMGDLLATSDDRSGALMSFADTLKIDDVEALKQALNQLARQDPGSSAE